MKHTRARRAAAIGIAILLIVGSLFASPAQAQEPEAPRDPTPPVRPNIAVLIGDPILPPAEVVIERVLYRSAYEDDPLFDCAAPISPVVEFIEQARWACYTITNTSTEAVMKFTLSDPDMNPAHTYIPVDPDDDGWFEAGEVATRQVEIVAGSTAFGSSAPFDGDSDDYEIRLEGLYAVGIADVLVTDFAAWGLYGLPLQVDASEPVSFEQQRAKWTTLGIDNYEMEFNPLCFCGYDPDAPPPFRIRVVDGAIESSVSIETGKPAPDWGMTINDMLDRIAEAVDPQTPAWQVTGTMDLLYGIPTSWSIDWSLLMVDDEFTGYVTNFTPLQECPAGLVPIPVDNSWYPGTTCDSIPVADGDVDCSGETNIIDALLIVLYEVGVAQDLGECPVAVGGGLALGIDAERGDVNGDGTSNILDALAIARCSVGIDDVPCAQMLLEH